jgi:hypothetical protein
MKLLPGYVAGLPKGSNCIDTQCGFIWNPQGLTVSDDIGGMAGPGLGPEESGEHAWYGEANINGQTVRYAVSEDEREFMVSFPASYANFRAELRNQGEFHTVLQMLLTYQGDGYKPDPKGAIDASLATHDGTLLTGVEVVLRRRTSRETQTARTDNKGHVHFLSVPAGRYDLSIASAAECSLGPRHWTITAEPAEILLRSFTVPCR